jgi:Spy/CpxP family protein refolding chaperone
MRLTQRILFLVAVVTMAMVVGTASAQQKGRGRGGFGFGGFGGTNLVTLATNEAVQKDLGLSGDVAGKLTSLRDDYRAAVQKDYQTAGINLQDFQNLTAEQRQKMTDIGRKLNDEFNPKVKALVSADQYKRLQQIQLQANLRNQGPSALTEADVAAELKVTDDQTKKLNELNTEFGRRQRELFSGGSFDQAAATKLREERTAKTMDVLTAEQKDKLKTLQGSPFDVAQLGFGGGRRGKN